MSGQLFFLRAYSAHLDPWTSIASLINPSFKQDSCLQNDLTLEVTGNSFNHSKIRIKQTFNFEGKRVNMNDELRFCLPIRNDSTLYGRVQNNNIRIQYDHGIRVWKGFVYTLYSCFNTSKNEGSTTNVQFGTILLSQAYNIDNLFKLSRNYVKWYHKTMIKLNQIRFGLVAVMDFHTSSFLKKDLLMGYHKDKFEVYAHATQGWNQLKYQPEHFSQYKLMFLYKQDIKRSLGIQVVLGKNLKSVDSVEGLIEFQYNDRSKTRIKLTNKFNVTLLVKNQWTQYLSTTLGCHLVMAQQNKIDKSRLGFKVQINV